MLKPSVIFPAVARASHRYDAAVRFLRANAAGKVVEIPRAGSVSQRRAELDALERQCAAQERALGSQPGAVLGRRRR